MLTLRDGDVQSFGRVHVVVREIFFLAISALWWLLTLVRQTENATLKNM